MEKSVLIDQMNLYDYVMSTFERFCDLTEGRRKSLNYYLNNCMAKYVNVAEFKSVFGISAFDEILGLLTDMTKAKDLKQYGLICYEEVTKEKAMVTDGPKLEKALR